MGWSCATLATYWRLPLQRIKKMVQKSRPSMFIFVMLYVVLYISTFHDVDDQKLKKVLEQIPPSQYDRSSWAYSQDMQRQMAMAYRIYSMQLLEYSSNSIFFTVLWCSLSLPVDFVTEYMNLQPLIRSRLESNSWMQKTNLRPDTCFEAVFKIVLGLVVLIGACIDNRIHGLLISVLYMFDLFYFYQKQPSSQSQQKFGVGPKRSAPRQNIYCCRH